MNKKKLIRAEIGGGLLLLLGGLITYALGLHDRLPVPRPDLIVYGTSLIGIGLIAAGFSDLFSKKTKEMEIEEKDERNIMLSNAAMAYAFKFMCPLMAIAIFALIFMGYLNEVSCFSMIGVLLAGEIVFVYQRYTLEKRL